MGVDEEGLIGRERMFSTLWATGMPNDHASEVSGTTTVVKNGETFVGNTWSIRADTSNQSHT